VQWGVLQDEGIPFIFPVAEGKGNKPERPNQSGVREISDQRGRKGRGTTKPLYYVGGGGNGQA